MCVSGYVHVHNFEKLPAEHKGYTEAHWLSRPSRVGGKSSCHTWEPAQFHGPLSLEIIHLKSIKSVSQTLEIGEESQEKL